MSHAIMATEGTRNTTVIDTETNEMCVECRLSLTSLFGKIFLFYFEITRRSRSPSVPFCRKVRTVLLQI